MALGFMENRAEQGWDDEPHLLGVPWPETLTWRGALVGLGLAGVVGVITYLGHLFG